MEIALTFRDFFSLIIYIVSYMCPYAELFFRFFTCSANELHLDFILPLSYPYRTSVVYNSNIIRL